MSTAALQNVWDGLLAHNLSTSDKRWLAERLWAQVSTEERYTLRPFSMDEMDAILNQAEAELAAGMGIPDEETWGELVAGE